MLTLAYSIFIPHSILCPYIDNIYNALTPYEDTRFNMDKNKLHSIKQKILSLYNEFPALHLDLVFPSSPHLFSAVLFSSYCLRENSFFNSRHSCFNGIPRHRLYICNKIEKASWLHSSPITDDYSMLVVR